MTVEELVGFLLGLIVGYLIMFCLIGVDRLIRLSDWADKIYSKFKGSRYGKRK